MKNLLTGLKLSLVVFMLGNLLGMGLKLKLREATAGLRRPVFVLYSVLWGFVLCPALAWLLTIIMPLDRAYADGLLLLGLAPCAPFLPMVVERAGGDLATAAAFMILAAAITVAYMPISVPIIVPGLTANAWVIARPLLLFVLTPLIVGILIQRASVSVADRLYPAVQKITGLATIALLALCALVYGKGFIGAIGSFAIATQIVFFSVATCASYALSFGLTPNEKSVLALGMATRNLGPAFAPLIAVPPSDERAVVMVALAAPIQIAFAFLTARWLARRTPTHLNPKSEDVAAQPSHATQPHSHNK